MTNTVAESTSKDVPKDTGTCLATSLDDLSFACLASEEEDMDSANRISKKMENVPVEYNWIKFEF